MDVNDLRRVRKPQLHSSSLRSWNYRGTTDFSAFAPEEVLAGDNWVSNAATAVTVNDITIFPGDMVLALTDNPGYLTAANVTANKWKINRNAGTSGDVMISASEFHVDTTPGTGNYNTTTRELTIPSLPSDFFRLTDNVNLYVNSAKYSYKHLMIIPGTNRLTWKNQSAGFDLETGDFIEIEIFRK